MTITFLNWKMKAKFNQILLVGSSPLYPMCPSHLLFWVWFWRAHTNFSPNCSTHVTVHGFINSHSFGSQAHSIWWNTDHFPSPFNFQPLTFLSEAWKNMHSYCCWGETKFNFWVGNWRVIHEQISSEWYDLLNFGLWFIFMYSCYC